MGTRTILFLLSASQSHNAWMDANAAHSSTAVRYLGTTSAFGNYRAANTSIMVSLSTWR